MTNPKDLHKLLERFLILCRIAYYYPERLSEPDFIITDTEYDNLEADYIDLCKITSLPNVVKHDANNSDFMEIDCNSKLALDALAWAKNGGARQAGLKWIPVTEHPDVKRVANPEYVRFGTSCISVNSWVCLEKLHGHYIFSYEKCAELEGIPYYLKYLSWKARKPSK